MKVSDIKAKAKLIPRVGSILLHHSGELDEKASAPKDVKIEKAGRIRIKRRPEPSI